MFIIEILLKVTNFSQQELSNYLGISRVSLNGFLKGKNISNASKKIICDKFNFPIDYFDYDVINKDMYNFIYLKIYKEYYKDFIDESINLNNLLNNIVIKKYNDNLNDDDIMLGICNGYNPFTGEIFDSTHILSNELIKCTLNKIYKGYKKYNSEKDVNNLSDLDLKKYNALLDYRNKKAKEECVPNYIVLSNSNIYDIVLNVKNKEDLLRIKGIGFKKYLKYSDDILNILYSTI